jgi:hypothetical protein
MTDFNTFPISKFQLNVPQMGPIPDVDDKLAVQVVLPASTPIGFYQLSKNALDLASNVSKDYAAKSIRQFGEHSNTTSHEISTHFTSLSTRLDAVEKQMANLWVENGLLKEKLADHTVSLQVINERRDEGADFGTFGAQASSGSQGIKTSKMSDVPYFTGNKSSNNKFQNWLNLLALFNEATGVPLATSPGAESAFQSPFIATSHIGLGLL